MKLEGSHATTQNKNGMIAQFITDGNFQVM
jgi:hypothetical protein